MTEQQAIQRRDELKYLIGKRYYHRKFPLKGMVEDVYTAQHGLDKYVVKIDVKLDVDRKKPNAPRIHIADGSDFIIYWQEEGRF